MAPQKAPKKKTAKQAAKKAAKNASAKKVASRARKTTAARTKDPGERVRAFCLSLPETTEVESWGVPTFRVNGKIFAMYASATTHHSSGRPAVWILSISIEQDLVLRARPDRYFKPPYVGPSGWIGAWLDKNPPWAEIEELLNEGWKRRAPKKLLKQL